MGLAISYNATQSSGVREPSRHNKTALPVVHPQRTNFDAQVRVFGVVFGHGRGQIKHLRAISRLKTPSSGVFGGVDI